jgi:two-component system cell cycle response regulator
VDEPLPPPPRREPLRCPILVVIQGGNIGAVYKLDRGCVTIGRESDNDIVVEHGSTSRYHVEIRIDADGVRLRDLQSANGTFVDSQPITGEVPLSAGARIKIGGTIFTYLAARGRGPR